MKTRLARYLPTRGSSVSVVLTALLGFAGLTACTQTEEAIVLENPPADSVTFWPPTLKYARQGDTLYLLINGMKRRTTCAVPLQVGWNFRRDTTGTEYYRARAKFEVPSGCAQDPKGLDTMFRVRFYTKIGNKLYLETPDTSITDSLQFIAGNAPSLAKVTQLVHVAGGADSLVSGRFTFRDSTATRPRRTLHVNALATCEILQTAVYERRGDTTIVKARLIEGEPRPASVFPPCAGPRADSVEVVFNRFNYLP